MCRRGCAACGAKEGLVSSPPRGSPREIEGIASRQAATFQIFFRSASVPARIKERRLRKIIHHDMDAF